MQPVSPAVAASPGGNRHAPVDRRGPGQTADQGTVAETEGGGGTARGEGDRRVRLPRTGADHDPGVHAGLGRRTLGQADLRHHGPLAGRPPQATPQATPVGRDRGDASVLRVHGTGPAGPRRADRQKRAGRNPVHRRAAGSAAVRAVRGPHRELLLYRPHVHRARERDVGPDHQGEAPGGRRPGCRRACRLAAGPRRRRRARERRRRTVRRRARRRLELRRGRRPDRRW